METILAWIRLVAVIVIFVGSCTGLGYLSGRWVRRHEWPGWLTLPISVLIALIWPAILFGIAASGARHYQPRSPSDPADAPAMVLFSVIFFGAPALFGLSIPFALIGEWLSGRK